MIEIEMVDGRVTLLEKESIRELPGVTLKVRPSTKRVIEHAGGTPIHVRKTQSRNAKCDCGSGKKFKNCCINISEGI